MSCWMFVVVWPRLKVFFYFFALISKFHNSISYILYRMKWKGAQIKSNQFIMCWCVRVWARVFLYVSQTFFSFLSIAPIMIVLNAKTLLNHKFPKKSHWWIFINFAILHALEPISIGLAIQFKVYDIVSIK